MDRNLAALQTEVGRLHKALAHAQANIQQLNQECQRLSLGGEQVQAEKIQAVSWIIALLLEHHQGECVISIPLVSEIAGGKQQYGTRSVVQADRLSMKLSVVDGEGNICEKPQAETRAQIKTAAGLIQAAVAEEQVERCPECGRKLPFHNLDCVSANLYTSPESRVPSPE